jgi:O-antigen/teichoic acid export membrane protein
VAPWVADFFGTPALSDVLRVLSLSLVIAGLSAVPMAMMNRALRFRQMAAVDVVSVVLGGAAGVIHALAGGQYWALVTHTLVGATITMIGLLIMNGRPSFRASLSRLREMFGFSSGIFGARIVQYVGSNGDNVLVARFLGATDLAFYTMAFRMQRLPSQTLGRLVNQVAFPVYSRLQHDPERIRSWFLLSTRSTAVLAYPLLTILVLLVPFLVPLVLGQAWTPAVVPMQLFTLGAFRAITLKQVGPVFMSFGRTSLVFRISLLEVVAILAGCGIGLRWGIVGVAAGYLAARILVTPVALRSVSRLVAMRRWQYTQNILPVWAACGLLMAAWFAVQIPLQAAGAAPAVTVPFSTLLGLLAYLVTLRYLFRSTWQDAAKVLAMVLGRSKKEPRVEVPA